MWRGGERERGGTNRLSQRSEKGGEKKRTVPTTVGKRVGKSHPCATKTREEKRGAEKDSRDKTVQKGDRTNKGVQRRQQARESKRTKKAKKEYSNAKRKNTGGGGTNRGMMGAAVK